MYVKFPGRDLGGFFSFFRGFTYRAWYAVFIFLLTVPAFLHVNYRILKYFELEEPNSWKYFWNIFVLFGALSQQVWNSSIQNWRVFNGILRDKKIPQYIHRVEWSSPWWYSEAWSFSRTSPPRTPPSWPWPRSTSPSPRSGTSWRTRTTWSGHQRDTRQKKCSKYWQ